jgi:hypothetical protein
MADEPIPETAKGEAGNIGVSLTGAEATGKAGEIQTDPDTMAWHQPDQTSEQIIAQNEERKRKFLDAVEASQNETPPLHHVQSDQGGGFEVVRSIESDQRVTFETNVVRATVAIIPTRYPEEPGGSITVHNYITINIHSAEFGEFNTKIDELLDHLKGSNEMAPDVRAKTSGEITAGATILASPKPDPNYIDLLLIRPLKWLAGKGRIGDHKQACHGGVKFAH